MAREKNTALWCPPYAKAVAVGHKDNHYWGAHKPHRQVQIQAGPAGPQPGIYPEEGVSQQDNGADVLDVNVGLP